jgi:hypothetical protein
MQPSNYKSFLNLISTPALKFHERLTYEPALLRHGDPICWFGSPRLDSAFSKHGVHCITYFLHILQCLFEKRGVPSSHRGVLARIELDPLPVEPWSEMTVFFFGM